MRVKGAWRIAQVAGVNINIHWSFSFVVLWVVWQATVGALGWPRVVFVSLAMVVLFVCVALHELGHALAARSLKVAVKNIIILPVGGLAQIQPLPEKPLADLLIAAAGPLVNLALAGSAGLLLAGLGQGRFLVGLVTSPETVMAAVFRSIQPQELFWGLLVFGLVVNGVLFVFNLIPAFPMDGGRIVRAALALALPYSRATRLAKWLGHAVAILLLLFALYFRNLGLFVVGGLVLLAGWLMKVGHAGHGRATGRFR